MGEAVKETFVPEDNVPPVVASGLRGFIAKFTVLKGAQRELWLTFLIKLFIISAYSITNKTLILWLSSDLGFSDQGAGALVGWVWAPAMTACTLLAGSVTDALGLRRTFFVGVTICAIARAVMVFTTVPWLALAGGLFPLVIGEALGTPVLIAATRRYSTVRQRSIAFSMIYMVMNVGYLKLIFLQMDYVFPKFGIRELGNGAPIGHLSNINYILIIILVPIIGALTQKYSAYRMVIVGGAICAASVFVMALPTSWFQGWAGGFIGQWIGRGYLGVQGSIHPYYVMIALYISIFSIGEAFYSPRVYEYAAAIAPRGQEASYGALSYIPFLIGKLLVGTGGFLLAAFVPEHGPRRPEIMWLIFAMAASVAPIGLVTFRRYIRVPEAGRPN